MYMVCSMYCFMHTSDYGSAWISVLKSGPGTDERLRTGPDILGWDQGLVLDWTGPVLLVYLMWKDFDS